MSSIPKLDDLFAHLFDVSDYTRAAILLDAFGNIEYAYPANVMSERQEDGALFAIYAGSVQNSGQRLGLGDNLRSVVLFEKGFMLHSALSNGYSFVLLADSDANLGLLWSQISQHSPQIEVLISGQSSLPVQGANDES